MDTLPPPDQLEPHPIALLPPPLSSEEARLLANDIRKRGLLHDIWLYEDAINGGEKKFYILDGRSRNEACVTEGVEPRYKIYDGTDPLGHAMSLNERRRHLSLAERRLLAKRIVEYDPTITDRELARKAGLGSHATAASVRREIAETDPSAPLVFPANRIERTLRKDGTPRRQRGRKPGTKSTKAKAKPNSRGQYIVLTGARLKADPEDTYYIWVAAAEDNHAGNQTLSDHTKRKLIGRWAKVLGYDFDDPPEAA